MGGIIGKRRTGKRELQEESRNEDFPTNSDRPEIAPEIARPENAEPQLEEEQSIHSFQELLHAEAEVETIERTRSDGVVRIKVAQSGRGRVELGSPSADDIDSDSPPGHMLRQRSQSEDNLAADSTISDSTVRAYQMMLREMSSSTENSEPSSEFQEMLSQMHKRANGEQQSLRSRKQSDATVQTDFSATSAELERMLRELSARFPESPMASLGSSELLAAELLREASSSTTASSGYYPRLPHRHSFGARSGVSTGAASAGGGWAARLGGDRALAQRLDFLRSLDSERRIRAEAKTPR